MTERNWTAFNHSFFLKVSGNELEDWLENEKLIQLKMDEDIRTFLKSKNTP